MRLEAAGTLAWPRDGISATASPATGYPHPSTPSVSKVMRGNRRVDTRPEVRLRSELHRLGLRFRKHRSLEAGGIRVRPDIVFPGPRMAVFVDGCFWHGCAEHGTQPRANATYWSAKLTRNHDRDRRVDESLLASGWHVVRIWEHVPVREAASQIAAALAGRTRT